jgi:hypothetical protein
LILTKYGKNVLKEVYDLVSGYLGDNEDNKSDYDEN